MIDSDQVKQGQVMGHALHPPPVALPFQHVPPVHGIAPELACFAEVVRGDAGDGQGLPRNRIQVEYVGVHPHVRAVMNHVDGEVADDMDFPVVAVRFEIRPLLEEDVLEEFHFFHA